MTDTETTTTPVEELTERVLSAAQRCFERFGVAKTSIEDVARAAGVSRKTVYRYFAGGRDEIVLTVLLRRGASEMLRIEREMAAAPTAAAGLVTGVVETIRAIRADEHLALLFAADAAGHTTAIAGRSEAMFSATRALLRRVLDRGAREGVLRAGANLEDLTELVLRLIGSFITVDVRRRRDDDDLSAFMHRCLVPAVFTDH